MKKALTFIFAIIFLTGTFNESLAAFVIPMHNATEAPGKPDSKTVSSALSEFMHLSRKERQITG